MGSSSQGLGAVEGSPWDILASLSKAVKFPIRALVWILLREGWAEGGVWGADIYKGVNYNKEPFLLQFLCRKHMFSDAGSSWVKDTL